MSRLLSYSIDDVKKHIYISNNPKGLVENKQKIDFFFKYKINTTLLQHYLRTNIINYNYGNRHTWAV